MPRFAPERWKPADDSSEGYRTLDPESVVLNVRVGVEGDASCPCGCGDFPLGDKATFCMGHDARLRGILIRAHLMGAPIRYFVGGTLKEPVSAYDIADQHVWKSYLDSAVLKRDGANRTVLRRSLGRDDLVEVGKWEYTGGQVAAVYRTNNEDLYEVEYVNRAGDIKRLRVPATPLAEVEV